MEAGSKETVTWYHQACTPVTGQACNLYYPKSIAIVRMTVNIGLTFQRWMTFLLSCDSLCHVEDSLHGTVLCFTDINVMKWKSVVWLTFSRKHKCVWGKNSDHCLQWRRSLLSSVSSLCIERCPATLLLLSMVPGSFWLHFSLFFVIVGHIALDLSLVSDEKRPYISEGWHRFELGPPIGTKCWRKSHCREGPVGESHCFSRSDGYLWI